MKATFYMPIIGLNMEMPDVEVGNVRFLKSYKTITDQSLMKVIDIFISPKSNTMPNQSSYMEALLRNNPIAIVQVNKTSDAETAAELEVERSLNVLRFYLSGRSGIDPFAHRMYMWIAGVPYTGMATFFSVDEISKQVSTSSSTRGAVFPYEFRLKTLENMKEVHFEVMNKILQKPPNQRTPLEKNIVTAVDFFGAGLHELRRRNSFLNFVISLEAALVGRSEKKAQKLAAWIGELLQLKRDNRGKLFSRISAYYNIRSDIVHEGIDNVKQNDIYGIWSLAFRTIARLVPYTEKATDRNELRKILYSESRANRQK
jgi:hypothetical protein